MKGTGVVPRIGMELVKRIKLDRFAGIRPSIHPMDHYHIRLDFVVEMCATDA
jgi:hypothetical protein